MKSKIDTITFPTEGNILSYYAELYDSAYITLSPFIEPISIDIDLFYPDTYPDKIKIISNCKSKSWNDLCKIANIDNINLMDIGLRSRINGIKKEYISKELIQKIEAIEKIVPPTEGILSPFTENIILNEFMNLRYSKIVVRSEHLDSIEIMEIKDIINEERIPYAGSFFTEDEKYYVTTHWDSHYSIICGNNNYLKEFVTKTKLEGFYCNLNTEIYWSIRSPET